MIRAVNGVFGMNDQNGNSRCYRIGGFIKQGTNTTTVKIMVTVSDEAVSLEHLS